MKINLGSKGNNENIFIECFTTSTKYRNTQHANTILPNGVGINGKAVFYNRPWESYYYQTALHDMADKVATALFNVPSVNALYKTKKWTDAKEYADWLKKEIDNNHGM